MEKNDYLSKKIDAAISLLQSTCKNEIVELCYSGGKDSDVILTLAKLAANYFLKIILILNYETKEY